MTAYSPRKPLLCKCPIPPRHGHPAPAEGWERGGPVQACLLQQALSFTGLLGTELPLLYIANGLRQLELTQSKCNIREQINGKDLNSGLLTRGKLVVNSELLWPESSHPGKPQAPLFLPLHKLWPILVLSSLMARFCLFFFPLKKKWRKKCSSVKELFWQPRGLSSGQLGIRLQQPCPVGRTTGLWQASQLSHHFSCTTQHEGTPNFLLAEPNAPT